MKICIIDDNESITKLLSRFFTMRDHETLIINSGREGLSILEKETFDVVLLDLAMPEFSGENIIDGLIKSGKIKDHKICIFTASSISDEEIERLRTKGAKEILKKPVDFGVLMSVLEKLVNTD